MDGFINEAVFDTEEKAKDYIAKRTESGDRDDYGAEFAIEPWLIQ